MDRFDLCISVRNKPKYNQQELLVFAQGKGFPCAEISQSYHSHFMYVDTVYRRLPASCHQSSQLPSDSNSHIWNTMPNLTSTIILLSRRYLISITSIINVVISCRSHVLRKHNRMNLHITICSVETHKY